MTSVGTKKPDVQRLFHANDVVFDGIFQQDAGCAASKSTITDMTTALSIADSKVIPLMPMPQFSLWQNELRCWQQEVSFYCRMLACSRLPARLEARQAFKKLAQEFDHYSLDVLPNMKITVDECTQGKTVRLGFPMNALPAKMEQLNDNLRRMKMEAFPFLSEYPAVSIW